MISDLHREEDEDLEVKEGCESDRMKNTKIAKKTSQDIDDKTAFINRKKAQVADLKQKMAAATAEIASLKLQLEEAGVNRKAETAEYEVAKADDRAAKGLIEKASTVLSKFYENEGLVLAQGKLAKHARAVQAPGEAPPPPPPTWSEPYGGSPGESNGIQAILQMIKDDIEKDIRDATAIEDKSQQGFDDYKADTEETIGTLEDLKSEYEGEVGDK